MRAFRFNAQSTATATFLSLAYLVTMWISVALAGPRTVPMVWACNGFLAAGMVLLDRRLALTSIIVCFVGGVCILMPETPRLGLAFAAGRSGLNAMEAAAAGWLASRVLGPRGLLRTGSGFLKLQFLAILPAAGGGWLVWAIIAHPFYNITALPLWRSGFVAHLMGMAVVMPAMLLIVQPALPTLKRPLWETAAILGGLTLISVIMLGQHAMPVAFAIMPAILFTAVRLGPRGSALGALLLSALALPATIRGDGVYRIHPQWDLSERAMIYHAFALIFLGAVSLGAFRLAEQARLRRLMTLRASAARAARRRALEASRAKTDFLATMSHEIRTPMNSILGFTQLLLRDGGLPTDARDKVEVIAQAGESLMTVLNDILDFAKVEAGKVELHMGAVDVCAVASQAIDILAAPARAKGLTLKLETDGAAGLFVTDAQRLKQILLNLLTNAVKFTEQGHVLLAVSLQDSVLRFAVRDTGIGIEEALIPRLFSRFSQVDSSTSRDHGGTGLGLAICKGLAQQMGGGVWATSRPGLGSTFWLELPAIPASQAPGLAASDEPPPVGSLGGRVLLVDDHAMNRRLGATLLGSLGCEVDLAASGEEAVQAAGRTVYDAILMDVHMPRMDGLAATRAIRALDGPGAAAPIIAMSADVMAHNLDRCRQAGMVDHIAKPIQLPVMHAVLERWLNAQKRRSAA
jgi:signal transduction histidine kinase/ActR/RegA family two-component response regulator